MTYPSKTIKDAARRMLISKHRNGVRPLAVTAQEIATACPGIAKDDIVNELAALACADHCRLGINIKKEIMLIWEI